MKQASVWKPVSFGERSAPARGSEAAFAAFAFVELIVPCPTGLKKSVHDAYEWCSDKMCTMFKPQVFKDEVEQK